MWLFKLSKFGKKCFYAHYSPKSTVICLKLVIAACLMAKKLSLSHRVQITFSLSLKNYSPNCLASIGKLSITCILRRQFFSMASSSSEEINDSCNSSMLITELRSSSLEKSFNRTSEDSSLKSNKKMGKMCYLEAFAPKIGHSERMLSESAALT